MGRLRVQQEIAIKGTKTVCKVLELLGYGGQGEVYRVVVDGKELALKWYDPNSQIVPDSDSLGTLVKEGAPNERFLWPIQLVGDQSSKNRGYLMPLRPKNFEVLTSLLSGRINLSFSDLCTAGIQLADAYAQLHRKGWCYGDISDRNVFLEPATGDILICDNDNVSTNRSKVSVFPATPGFRAPEIERMEVREPSSRTDQYSLAVLLFNMFMLGHPLLGKLYWQQLSPAIDAIKLLSDLLGWKPLFIFSSTDPSNEPDDCQRWVRDYWSLYPRFFRDLFTRTFTVGLNDPGARVTESEWRRDLARLQDNIIYCSCGTQNFYDPSLLGQAHCWRPSCGKAIRLPFRIRIGSRTITLNHDRRLFPHHLNTTSYDFKTPVAEVTQNPKHPAQWGLKNMGSQKWVMTLPDTSVHDIEPGRSVILSKGKKINFGNVEGEICT